MNSTSSSTEAAQIYLRQALSYCDQQQWSSAIAACQKALELAPKLAQAYKIWGNALLGSGKNAEAMGCYAEAIAIEPNLTEVYANMGSIYARQQKWQQALEYYQKAIAINPEFTGAYRHLARVWQELGESLKAWECQERVLSLEPDKGSAAEHLQLANELKQQAQLEKAVLHYRYAIKIEPNLHEAYQNLAETLEKLGQWQEAATYYRQLIEIDLNARKGLTSPSKGGRGSQGESWGANLVREGRGEFASLREASSPH
jgi:tetratricopeptide (TPR) repeat protein